MKPMNENKKWIISAVIVSLCFLLFLYFGILRNVSFLSYDELWPEQGKVIATIDGEKYRYDPVYLFRLTNCIFDDDYNKGRDGIIDKGLITYASVDVLNGNTMAKTAVCLELMFREGMTKLEGSRVHSNYIKTEYEAIYSALDAGIMPETNPKISLALKKAKFYQGQSDSSYFQELAPYMKKWAYIDQTIQYYDTHKSEYMNLLGVTSEIEFNSLKADESLMQERLREKLMEKYNVQMTE